MMSQRKATDSHRAGLVLLSNHHKMTLLMLLDRVMRMSFWTFSRESQKSLQYYLRQFPGISLIIRRKGRKAVQWGRTWEGPSLLVVICVCPLRQHGLGEPFVNTYSRLLNSTFCYHFYDMFCSLLRPCTLQSSYFSHLPCIFDVFFFKTFSLCLAQPWMCYIWKILTDGIIKINVMESIVVSLFT